MRLSSSWVRGGGGGGGSGRGEEEERQLQRAVGGLPVGEGPLLHRGPGRPRPAPPNWPSECGAGGVPASHKGAPHSSPQPGIGHSPHEVHHPQSSPQQLDEQDIIFMIPILQRRKLRLGLVQLKAQGCSPAPVPSAGSCHCPRGWAHSSGCRGGARTDVVLRGTSWPVLYSPGQCKAGWDLGFSWAHHPAPYRHTHPSAGRPSPPLPNTTISILEIPIKGSQLSLQSPGAPSWAPTSTS